MDYNSINDYLLIRIPEVKEEAEEIMQYWSPEQVPSHVFYGDTLNRFVFKLLEEDSNKELIKKVFDFYEELAACDDEKVNNLLQVTLLEYLWDDYKVLRNAHKYMHHLTRKLSDELQVYFKKPAWLHEEGEYRE